MLGFTVVYVHFIKDLKIHLQKHFAIGGTFFSYVVKEIQGQQMLIRHVNF